jgi:hypothetical protein
VEQYVQEFTDPDTGEISGATFEPLEFWTEAGWEMIPAGFRFSFRSIPAPVRKMIRKDEIPLLILLEWRRASGNSPRGGMWSGFRHELIKRARKRQNATEGRFWRFLTDWARLEVICFMVRLFGIIRAWYVFKN